MKKLCLDGLLSIALLAAASHAALINGDMEGAPQDPGTGIIIDWTENDLGWIREGSASYANSEGTYQPAKPVGYPGTTNIKFLTSSGSVYQDIAMDPTVIMGSTTAIEISFLATEGGWRHAADGDDITVELRLTDNTVLWTETINLDEPGAASTGGTWSLIERTVILDNISAEPEIRLAFVSLPSGDVVFIDDVAFDVATVKPHQKTVQAGDVNFSWYNIDPNSPDDAVTVDVYLGKDPNSLNPTYNWNKVIDAKDVTGQTQSSETINITENATFYWQIVTYFNGIEENTSNLFTFQTHSDFPPTVNAGPDIVTWLENGTVDIQMDATVTDEGTPTLLWAPNDNPDVSFSDSNIEDPLVTITKEGVCQLTLSADDGVNNDPKPEDTCTIYVYADSCEAAQSLGNYTAPKADINSDCIVDLEDLAIVAGEWLQNTSLNTPIEL